MDNLQNAIRAVVLVANDQVCQEHQLLSLVEGIVNDMTNSFEQGPFFLGAQMCLVDVHIAPFALRLRRVLYPKKGYPMVEGVTSAGPLAAGGRAGERWARWVAALEASESVKATTSSDELYTETAGLLLQTGIA